MTQLAAYGKIQVLTDSSIDADVLAARTGDRVAFERLVTRYRGLVFAISLSTMRNVSASEDVAQEVFLAVWRDLGSLRDPASFLPWLRQLARRRALDAARARRRRADQGPPDDSILESAADPRPTAHDELLTSERARAVVLGIEALPEEAREVVTLYYREGQSIEQVACLLGMRQDAAKKRLSRARVTLRKEVLARFADSPDTTTPQAFTCRVMRSLPPIAPSGVATAGKAALPLLTKSLAFALAWAWLAGLVGSIAGVLWGLRRDLRRAIDARERAELWLIAAVVIISVGFFELGVLSLPARAPTTASRRLWLGTCYTLAYSAVIYASYYFGHRRLRMRRRQAEIAAHPGAAARHAREDLRGRLFGLLAGASIIAILIAAWVRG
jgi:RNA polymerase sigma factor (sigma-70 family)